MSETNITIRHGRAGDAELVARFIVELAAHEGVLHETNPSVENLRRQFAPGAREPLLCLIAEIGQEPVGYAIAYPAYVSNTTSWSFYVRDIFVRETQRGRGIGKALMRRLARTALRAGYRGLEFEVLKHNVEAREFYELLGAVVNPEAGKMYLEGEAFEKLLE